MGCLSSKQKEQLITISEKALLDVLQTLEPNEQLNKIAQMLLTEPNKKTQASLTRIAKDLTAPLDPPKLERQ